MSEKREPTKISDKTAPSEQIHLTEDYYRRLRIRLRLGLLATYALPLTIILLYFHFQFHLTLQESGKLHLYNLAESQRNTIDLFLQERVLNIFNLYNAKDFQLAPDSDDMRLYLQNLRGMSDVFIDVGFFDESGIQIGYAGPYPYLQGKDYSQAEWFRRLMAQSRNYYISDIFPGFRQENHFVIAVKQLFGGTPHIVRATIDPEKFGQFLRATGKDEDPSLVNCEGKYQIVDPRRAQLLEDSVYRLPRCGGAGTYEIEIGGETTLVAYAWLREAPWALVVAQPLSKAYSGMYGFQRAMLWAACALVLLILAIVWFATDRLLRRAKRVEVSKVQLKSQLYHASKLVAVGELAGGVAHEINNPLAIIASESGVIRDMLDPELGLECSPDLIRKELEQVDRAVYRIRGITQKLLNLVRKNESRKVSCNVNQVLQDLVSGLLEREFQVADIELIRELDPELPQCLSDPDQLRQVFLNIINNAADAVVQTGKPGFVKLATSQREGFACVAITDTGVGMTSEQLEKIFFPFYTTKEVGKGTGLGLSITLKIVEDMGSKIEVQSVPGAGSSFTVRIPLESTQENKDGKQSE